MESRQQYLWPANLKGATAECDIDTDAVQRLCRHFGRERFIIVVVLSASHLPIGLLWARLARRACISNFAFAATDRETAKVLAEHSLPFFRVRLSPALVNATGFVNPGGFSGPGVAAVTCRLTVVRLFLEEGVPIISCDADALVIKDPQEYIDPDCDIAFQRVVYFPEEAVAEWGFAACAGFVAYRPRTEVLKLLEVALRIQDEVSSDQLALNLALLESQVHWSGVAPSADGDSDEVLAFCSAASTPVRGWEAGTGLRLLALAATTFWRHDFVPLNLGSAVLIHPNSPKLVGPKLSLLHWHLKNGVCL